jgi:hypothetical protein
MVARPRNQIFPSCNQAFFSDAANNLTQAVRPSGFQPGDPLLFSEKKLDIRWVSVSPHYGIIMAQNNSGSTRIYEVTLPVLAHSVDSDRAWARTKKQNCQMHTVPVPEDGIGRPISPGGRRGLVLIPGQLDFIANDRRRLPVAWPYSSPA